MTLDVVVDLGRADDLDENDDTSDISDSDSDTNVSISDEF